MPPCLSPNFVESIRLEAGIPQLLDLHKERMWRTLGAHHLPKLSLPDVEGECPKELRSGVVKCRVVYGRGIERLEYAPYRRRRIESIALSSLPAGYSYAYKMTSRAVLEQALDAVRTDEVLLIDPQGRVRDSSFSNLLFLREGRWYTPTTPLLEGVQRTHLLRQGRIALEEITIATLHRYSHVGFINALNPLEEMPSLPLSLLRR